MTTIEKMMYQLSQKGISPSKMMKDLKFSTGLFSQWKKGLQNPSNEKIKAIANYLEVPIDYFLCQTDYEETCANAVCYGVNNQNNASIKGDNPVTSTIHKSPIFRLFADLSGIFSMFLVLFLTHFVSDFTRSVSNFTRKLDTKIRHKKSPCRT